jgi:hypothetical protein
VVGHTAGGVAGVQRGAGERCEEAHHRDEAYTCRKEAVPTMGSMRHGSRYFVSIIRQKTPARRAQCKPYTPDSLLVRPDAPTGKAFLALRRLA